MGDQPDSLLDLRLWQRFHVRLTLLYGSVVVLLVVAPMAAVFYDLGSQSQMKALQQHLLSTAVATAIDMDGDEIRGFVHPEDANGAAYRELDRRVGAVLRSDPSIYSIYVLVPTDKPGVMKFAYNMESSRSIADSPQQRADPTIGEEYEVARFPVLVDALHGPRVESELVFDDWTWTISGYAPVKTLAGEVVGVLGVDVDGKPVATMRRRVLISAGGVALGGVLLFSLGGILVGRAIRRPLERLIDATGRIAHGDLRAELGLRRRDEFGVVGHHFDQMARGLRERERIRATFGRYVSEDVARALLADPASTALGGEVRRVTILFSDLRGYSTISEHLEPAEIVDLLNRYFGAMNTVLDEHGGVVIEFLGDAILAVFGAPAPLDGHAEAAVRCAVAMRELLAELNVQWERARLAERWHKVGLDALGQRIGIHTGDVVAGNLGSERRTKYAVIGDTVNLAARLEQLNKEVDSEGILLSGEVVAELPDELRQRCRHVVSRRVKGREANVEVWAV